VVLDGVPATMLAPFGVKSPPPLRAVFQNLSLALDLWAAAKLTPGEIKTAQGIILVGSTKKK
jgi:hypothetical protein